MSELRKSSAPVLRGGAGVDEEILKMGEVPGFDPAMSGLPNWKHINNQDQSLNKQHSQQYKRSTDYHSISSSKTHINDQ